MSIIRWFARVLLLGLVGVVALPAQDPCRSIDPTSTRSFLPTRVPLETESIPVDQNGMAGLEFPDNTRIAIAPLVTAGYTTAIQQKYEFVMLGETRVTIANWQAPAGLVGLGLEPAEADAPTRVMVARDFSGEELGRVVLRLDAARPPVRLTLEPRGPREFELRVGRYVAAGSQR